MMPVSLTSRGNQIRKFMRLSRSRGCD
jgi:hypothetical protein